MVSRGISLILPPQNLHHVTQSQSLIAGNGEGRRRVDIVRKYPYIYASFMRPQFMATIIEEQRVTVHNPEAEHRDPALAAFLGLIEKDIAAGRRVRDLPAGLTAAMRRALKQVPVDLEEKLEGEVAL